MGTIRGLITLALMLTFIALVVWLASSRNKHRFDAAANIPLEDAPLASDASTRSERKP